MRFSVISSIMAQSRKRRKKRCRSMKFPWIAVRSQDKKIPKMSKLPSVLKTWGSYIYHIWYGIYHSQDKGDTSPILLSPDSGHCSSSHSIGMNVNNMVNTSRICKSISLQFPRWRNPHHLLFDAEKVSKSGLWCFESLKTRSLSGWQQHGFPSPVAPTSLLLTSPGALTLWHCDIVTLSARQCHDVTMSGDLTRSRPDIDLFSELSPNQPSQQILHSRVWFEYS